MGMFAHGYGDSRYAHYTENVFPNDSNFTIGFVAKFFTICLSHKSFHFLPHFILSLLFAFQKIKSFFFVSSNHYFYVPKVLLFSILTLLDSLTMPLFNLFI